MSTTDRLLATNNRLIAYLIAYLRFPTTGYEERRSAYAAERLALAEQQVDAAPKDIGNTDTISVDPYGGDWITKGRHLAREVAERHKFEDEGSYDLCDEALNEILNAFLSAKPAADQPRADWIEPAKRRAIEAWDTARQNPSIRSTTAAMHIVLDAFIAAMPQGSDILSALGWLEAERKKSAALGDLVQHCWIHSGHPNCGYWQMTTEQKALYGRIVGEHEGVQSPDPQPEEVPDCPADVILSARQRRKNSDVIGALDLAVQDGWHSAWNAARRYGPMPPKVTEEMVDAAVVANRDFCGNTEMRAVIREELEAALAASPKLTYEMADEAVRVYEGQTGGAQIRMMHALEAALAAASPKDTDQ